MITIYFTSPGRLLRGADYHSGVRIIVVPITAGAGSLKSWELFVAVEGSDPLWAKHVRI